MSELSETNPTNTNQPSKKLPKWIPILGFFLLLLLGIFAGIQSGYSQRRAAQATVVAQQVDEQFQLGLEAMNNGQYEIAFQHFNFVVQNAPSYEGLKEALNQLARWTVMSPTPLPSATPTMTPTPDLRGAEAIFNQAKEFIAGRNWESALNALDALRKVDPTYRVVEVDGMYYIALRNQGMAKIFPANCQDTNLEGGIYDLTLAERFGPLDGEADGARTFARFYLTAAAFWEVDWVKAQYYFSQAARGYPNLMDATCKTSQERWRYATIEYAKQLMAAEDYCNAQLQFEAAFSVYSNEHIYLYPTATDVYYKCNPIPPTAIPLPTSGSETPTPSETPSTP